MKDGYGREIEYMRISVTDRCNLRCRYCMPQNIDLLSMDEILTYEEIVFIVRCAVNLGIKKFKITGGEPLVRRKITDLISMIKAINGVESVTLTTNGILLDEYIDDLYSSGIDGINISLDTLSKSRYEMITKTDGLDKVLLGLNRTLDYGIKCKINSVVMKDFTKENYFELFSLAKDRNVDVRLIEIMPIGFGAGYEGIHCNEILNEYLADHPGTTADESRHGNGPAEYYSIPGYKGTIGIIDSIHNCFCESCNRIRLTSVGEIKPCLYYKDTISLKDVLRNPGSKKAEAVTKKIREAILQKPCGHNFNNMDKNIESRRMSQIGG